MSAATDQIPPTPAAQEAQRIYQRESDRVKQAAKLAFLAYHRAVADNDLELAQTAFERFISASDVLKRGHA